MRPLTDPRSRSRARSRSLTIAGLVLLAFGCGASHITSTRSVDLRLAIRFPGAPGSAARSAAPLRQQATAGIDTIAISVYASSATATDRLVGRQVVGVAP